MATTFGLDSLAAERASPMNLRTNSASSDSSGCAIFSATTRSRRVSVPRYTLAIPPRAIRASTWYRPPSSWPTGVVRAASIGNSVGADSAARPALRTGRLAAHRRRGGDRVEPPRYPPRTIRLSPGDHSRLHRGSHQLRVASPGHRGREQHRRAAELHGKRRVACRADAGVQNDWHRGGLDHQLDVVRIADPEP